MADATQERMRTKLREELGFIERSARFFDAGHEEEALRLATTMRVLFHDTALSTSLLTHLSRRHTTMMCATRRTDHADWRDFLNIRVNPHSSTPITLNAKRGAQFARVPVEVWWKSDSVMNASGVSVSRSRIILGAANRDGGAHVDRKLQSFYEHLIGGQFSVGLTGDLTYDGEPPFPQGQVIYPPNGHLALIRQFAHECLCTATVYRWLE